VPVLPRARTGPGRSPQNGHTEASWSIKARQCRHMRTELLDEPPGEPKDDAKDFFNRCH
jgi:hypothetical protein